MPEYDASTFSMSSWPRRVILSRGKARQLNLSVQRRDTSRPVVSFAFLIMCWRTTSAALPSCGAAHAACRECARRALVLGQPPPAGTSLAGPFDLSSAGNEQGTRRRTAQAPLRNPPRLTHASRRPSQPVSCWSADCLTALSSVAIAPL